MKYEITVENDRIIEMRPIDESKRFEGICIGPYEASGMAISMRELNDYMRKEEPNSVINRLIEINESYARTLERLAKQLGHPGMQEEDENEH